MVNNNFDFCFLFEQNEPTHFLLQITVLDVLIASRSRYKELPWISRFFFRVAIEKIFETEVDAFGYLIEAQTLADSVS